MVKPLSASNHSKRGFFTTLFSIFAANIQKKSEKRRVNSFFFVLLTASNVLSLGKTKEKPGFLLFFAHLCLLLQHQKRKSMKIAFLISAHTDPHQLFRLTERLPEDSEIFVHVDLKSDLQSFCSLITSPRVQRRR